MSGQVMLTHNEWMDVACDLETHNGTKSLETTSRHMSDIEHPHDDIGVRRNIANINFYVPRVANGSFI